jgi:hypothetical protein
MRDRAECIFAAINSEIAATRAGRFFKSKPIIAKAEGFRWWLTTLKSKGVDRFGLQIMTSTAEPRIVHLVRDALRENFFEKISGNRVELYKEVSSLPDDTPDIEAIQSIHEEILNLILEVIDKSKPTTLPKSFQFSIDKFKRGRQSIQCRGSELHFTNDKDYGPSQDHILNPSEEEWEEFWKQLQRLGVWEWKDSYYNLCCDGTSWSLEAEHEGRRVTSGGGNSYPGVKGTNYGKTFTSFLKALNQLVGEEIIPVNQYPNTPTPHEFSSKIILNSFTPAYQYRIKNGDPVAGKILDEKLWCSAGVVYARVCEKVRDIVYIGKTDGKLKGRILDHLRRITEYTKPRDIEYREWAEGKTVTIYAHKPKKVNCLGMTISTHAGLESALIDSINPKFVFRR